MDRFGLALVAGGGVFAIIAAFVLWHLINKMHTPRYLYERDYVSAAIESQFRHLFPHGEIINCVRVVDLDDVKRREYRVSFGGT